MDVKSNGKHGMVEKSNKMHFHVYHFNSQTINAVRIKQTQTSQNVYSFV